MRAALFALALPFLLYKALKDPIWSVAFAAYFYFAIPERELWAPRYPYQATFWVLAIVTAGRVASKVKDQAVGEMIQAAAGSARLVLERVREGLAKLIVNAAAANVGGQEIRRRALAYSTGAADDAARAVAPGPLLGLVRDTAERTLRAAVGHGAHAAEEVVHGSRGHPAGAVRAAVEKRVVLAVDATVAADVETSARHAAEQAIRDDEIATRRARDSETRGPLGLPMPPRALTAVAQNWAIWLHAAFLVLTIAGARGAKYDDLLAEERVETAALLFLPLVAITAVVRTADSWRIFTGAWLVGIWQLSMNGINQWLRYGGRADSPGGQGNEANFLGAIAVIAVPAGLAIALSDPKRAVRILGAIGSACAVLAIVASGSRSGLIGLAGALGYWAAHARRKKLALGVALLGVSATLAVAPDQVWERAAETFGEADSNPWIPRDMDMSARERIELWQLAAKTFAENPARGIGPQQFVKESEVLAIRDAYRMQRGMMTHNSWLQIAAEYGIVGLGIWGGAFLLSMAALRRARNKLAPYAEWRWFGDRCLGFEAGMAGTVLVLCFNSFHWYDYVYWCLVLGPMSLAIATLIDRRLRWARVPPQSKHMPPPRRRRAGTIRLRGWGSRLRRRE